MSRNAEALIDGAMKGYQFVDGIYRRKKYDKERAEEQAERKKDREHRRGILDRQADNSDRRVKMAEERQQMDRDFHDRRMKQMEKMDKGLDAKAFFDRTSQKDYKLTDHDKELARDLGLELDKLRDDGTKYNLNQLVTGVSNYLSGKDRGAINSPQFLQSFNKVFENKINRNFGVGFTPNYYPGGQITKKEVAGIMPGKAPGTVVIDLKVSGKDKDGKPFEYFAPATVGRGTDDDEVKQIPVEQVLGDIQTRHFLANDENSLNSLNQKLREIMIRGGVEPGEQFSDPERLGAGYIQRDSRNKAYPVTGIGRGAGKTPAIVQEIEYYRANNKTFDEAVRMANQGSPEKTRAMLVQALLKDPMNNGMEPEELQARVDQYMQVIYQNNEIGTPDKNNQADKSQNLKKGENESADDYISRIVG